MIQIVAEKLIYLLYGRVGALWNFMDMAISER